MSIRSKQKLRTIYPFRHFHPFCINFPVIQELRARKNGLIKRFSGLITDRDHVVAVSGISRREVLERRVSHGLDDQIENRRSFSAGDGQSLQPIESVSYYALVQSPIISSGDVCGSVMFLQNKESDRPGDAEQKLIQAAASYLGKQMEL